GFGTRPDYSFVRVVDGFSARLDPGALAVLERDPRVLGVYPVRAAFPATVSSGRLAGSVGPEIALPGFDGDGVTVALLDTGVDRSQPFLRGRVRPGIDILGSNDTAEAQRDPH